MYRDYAGCSPETVEKIPLSGGNREYWRLSSPKGGSLVAVRCDDLAESRAFIKIASHLRRCGIPVPEILDVRQDGRYCLQSDLGRTTLYDIIAPGREGTGYSEGAADLLEMAVRWLPHIQLSGAEGFDPAWCSQPGEFTRRSIFYDLNYFKYCYLRRREDVRFNEDALEDDFDTLAGMLLEPCPQGFMYRDFQARNIICGDGGLGFVDFQGGRIGPVFYDLASFVWQARSNFPEPLRRRLTDAYLSEFRKVSGGGGEDVAERGAFYRKLLVFVLFRTLQVLGAYGHRGLSQGRARFADSIPFALRNLRRVFSVNFLGDGRELAGLLPELSSVALRLAGPEPSLTVTVMSFSYRKGLPEDPSGNGGGFVFDCRAVNNPGRCPEFAQMTGMDRPVKDFLEKDGTVVPFLEHAMALVEAQVQVYIARGFTHLQVAFGCTGGQHRSVYCAEKAAVRLRDRFGVKVNLVHREQGRSFEL